MQSQIEVMKQSGLAAVLLLAINTSIAGQKELQQKHQIVLIGLQLPIILSDSLTGHELA